MRKLRSYVNKAEMLADGWTEEEIIALSKEPRTSKPNDSTDRFIWPEVDGVKILYCAFTKEEKMAYTSWRKAKTGTDTEGKKVQSEIWDRLEKAVAEIPEALELVKQLRPVRRDSILYKLFGTDNVGSVPKCTLEWIMFRSPQGEWYDNPMLPKEELGQLFIDGWTPVFTKQEVLKMVDALKVKGIDVSGCITNL